MNELINLLIYPAIRSSISTSTIQWYLQSLTWAYKHWSTQSLNHTLQHLSTSW